MLYNKLHKLFQVLIYSISYITENNQIYKQTIHEQHIHYFDNILFNNQMIP